MNRDLKYPAASRIFGDRVLIEAMIMNRVGRVLNSDDRRYESEC